MSFHVYNTRRLLRAVGSPRNPSSKNFRNGWHSSCFCRLSRALLPMAKVNDASTCWQVIQFSGQTIQFFYPQNGITSFDPTNWHWHRVGHFIWYSIMTSIVAFHLPYPRTSYLALEVVAHFKRLRSMNCFFFTLRLIYVECRYTLIPVYVFSTFCMSAGEQTLQIASCHTHCDCADFITKRLDIAIVHLQFTWETLGAAPKTSWDMLRCVEKCSKEWTKLLLHVSWHEIKLSPSKGSAWQTGASVRFYTFCTIHDIISEEQHNKRVVACFHKGKTTAKMGFTSGKLT